MNPSFPSPSLHRATSHSQPSKLINSSHAIGEEEDSFPFPKEDEELLSDDGEEEESALDRSLDQIGIGAYQKRLLVLCGLGWAADNMSLQCVSVILPRVQEHFGISDRWIGLLSAHIFAGMMVGAWAWGSYSDSQGRKLAFNSTLLITAIFGFLAAFAPNFPILCVLLFGLGTGVGGSMPTDGTLFLENIPKRSAWLLTALSIFFSFGAVVTSVLSLIIIPKHSCPEHLPLHRLCDMEKQNNGWRWLLGILSIISLGMFLSRVLFFRLSESPRYLAASGDHAGALESLQRISKFNGDEEKEWSLTDVMDKAVYGRPSSDGNKRGGERGALGLNTDYDSTGDSPLSGGTTPTRISTDVITSPDSTRSRATKNREDGIRFIDRLPTRVADFIEDNLERTSLLFEPKYRLSTQLIWTIWTTVSAAYTIFNVFLPKYLESKVGQTGGTRLESLQDYLIYTLSGMPGSILGAYMIESSWGRKGTMVFSTLATFVGILIFVASISQTAVVASSMLVSLAATLMWAVIYSYTPEVFEARVRGTACGIASAFSRLAGILAPILTGILLTISITLPLYASSFLFLLSAAAMIALPIETRRAGGADIS